MGPLRPDEASHVARFRTRVADKPQGFRIVGHHEDRRRFAPDSGLGGASRAAPAGPATSAATGSVKVTGRNFLTGTSFALTGGSAEAGGFGTLWGRGASTRL